MPPSPNEEILVTEQSRIRDHGHQARGADRWQRGRGRLHGQTLEVRILSWAGREAVLENGDLESNVRVG